MLPPKARPQERSKQPKDARSEAGSAAGSAPDQVKETPLVLIPQPPAKKPKKVAPQDAVDEFWAKFNSKTPGIGNLILIQSAELN